MQISAEEINTLVTFITFVFILVPVGLIFYIKYYYERKRKLIEEKEQMSILFETELLKTQREVQEQTLQTIGSDLHDNIGQLLSLISLTLNSIELQHIDKAAEKIETAIGLTSKSIQEMRHLGKVLQGDQLIRSGISEAIGYEVDWLEKTGRFEISFQITGINGDNMNYEKDLFTFRIFQEALNNIIKHADATKIDIALQFLPNTIQLKINDNGKGFNALDEGEINRGIGLQNMKKRVDIIGGKLSIDSSLSNGTIITATLPYP